MFSSIQFKTNNKCLLYLYLRQNISDLEDMMNFVHQGMFIHRYRYFQPDHILHVILLYCFNMKYMYVQSSMGSDPACQFNFIVQF